tara:strand:+ start:133 stop:339 length:207 start_codon:yes stop_codon:yes gene_type:complete
MFITPLVVEVEQVVAEVLLVGKAGEVQVLPALPTKLVLLQQQIQDQEEAAEPVVVPLSEVLERMVYLC